MSQTTKRAEASAPQAHLRRRLRVKADKEPYARLLLTPKKRRRVKVQSRALARRECTGCGDRCTRGDQTRLCKLADNSGSPRSLKHGWYHHVTLRTTPSGKVIGVEEGRLWREVRLQVIGYIEYMAERVGFEPTVAFRPLRFSSPTNRRHPGALSE